MGIPSYFKHLLDRYPQLLRPTGADTKANVLLMDFNCLIYGCVQSKKLPVYSHATRDAWETALLAEISNYVVHLWNLAGKPEQVVLAVDGVVPMAKIRQQRLRRFKSVWMTAKERELGARPVDQEVWDTNSITPGTEFMERLTVRLETLAKARTGWVVSGAEQPGEGEQKLMEWVRRNDTSGKHVVVYGLDADLILLCLLHCNHDSWSILREKQEFIKKAVPTDSEKYPPCLLLSISGLQGILFPSLQTRVQEMHDYIAGMSLLGNDFIPHSLGIHLRHGGHDRLVAVLHDLHADSVYLVSQGPSLLWQWNHAALSRVFEAWTKTEEEDIEHAFKQKYTMRGPPPRSPAEQCMLPVQNFPLEDAQERTMWNRQTGKLLDTWKEKYYMEMRERPLMPVEIQERCKQYCSGLQWTLDYYCGQAPVDQEWMYPWTYAPLWSDLHGFLLKCELPEAPQPKDIQIKPQEQLTIVLPLESFHLIRRAELRAIPQKIPHFWPKTFGFTTLGKRWMWECPPTIPILTIRRLLITDPLLLRDHT